MKIKINKLSEREIVRTLDTLYTAASSVKGREAMKMFLKDLLSPSERIMLGRRIIIARKLLAGETHKDIVGNLGVGYDTIARVQKWLDDQMPGYEQAIAKVEKEFSGRRLNSTNTLSRLKRKYPLHFLFFPNPKSK